MKDFITYQWKKILIGTGIFGLVIILFKKILAKKTLIEDYVKYGKDIEGTGKITGRFANVLGESASVPEGMVKLTIVFMVAILVVLFIASLGNKPADKAKKK